MVAQHYRWDFIGLSTDTKPTPETSEKVVDGSTFYCSDNSKLYVWCKNQWYEKEVSGGGGTTYTAGDGINIADNTISVDTTTIQPKLTAGIGIDITDNTISATGGGGGITELTSADFNYPTDNPDGIALWLLDEGEYVFSTNLKVYKTTSLSATWNAKTYLKIILKANTALHYDEDSGKWSDIWMGAGGTGFTETYLMYGTIKQGTGTSTADVMSQNAVTGMVFADPSTQQKIKIGAGTSSSEGNNGVEIGHNAYATGYNAVALGYNAGADATGSVALGFGSYAHGYGRISLGAASGSNDYTAGVMTIGPSNTLYGYKSTNYRLLTGLYDGQSAHDAATVAQGNTLATSAPTTSTVGVLGQLYTDTTNMHTYQCTAISGSTYTWTQRW